MVLQSINETESYWIRYLGAYESWSMNLVETYRSERQCLSDEASIYT